MIFEIEEGVNILTVEDRTLLKHLKDIGNLCVVVHRTKMIRRLELMFFEIEEGVNILTVEDRTLLQHLKDNGNLCVVVHRTKMIRRLEQPENTITLWDSVTFKHQAYDTEEELHSCFIELGNGMIASVTELDGQQFENDYEINLWQLIGLDLESVTVLTNDDRWVITELEPLKGS
jgi:hypothetical protein